jgi:hypothetical protein
MAARQAPHRSKSSCSSRSETRSRSSAAAQRSLSSLISVIIPHYNRSRLLADAVTSVLAGDNPEVEIIVVDDGSTDDEWSRAKALAAGNVRVIRRESGPEGPSRCRNLGATQANGELLVFLDSDDLMAPWCLGGRLSQIGIVPDGDCWVFPVLLFIKSPGDSNTLWNDLDTDEDDGMRFARSDPPWHTSSVLWKKSAFVGLGGFDENLFYGDDSDLHLRAVLGGLSICKFPDALPDVFVRRSSEPRITNTENSHLLESRLRRLSAGTRFLKSAPELAPYMRVWAGQYFMEGEYLLFNLKDPAPLLAKLLAVWQEDAPANRLWHNFARVYFAMTSALKEKAYFAVRAGRRLAKLVFPDVFFPRPGGFENTKLNESAMTVVRQRLAASG